MIVGLADLKRHFNLSRNDTSRDDDVLASGTAAEIQISQWIGRPIYARVQDLPAPGSLTYDPGQIVADAAVTAAIKMMARRMFDAPSGEGSAGEDAVPPASVRALLSGHRRFAVLP